MNPVAYFLFCVFLEHVYSEETTTIPADVTHEIKEEPLSPKYEHVTVDLVCYQLKAEKVEDCWDSNIKDFLQEDLPQDLSTKQDQQSQHDETERDSHQLSEDISCDFTNNKLNQKGNSDKSEEKCKGREVYSCELCGMIFKYRINFYNHKKSHESRKSLLCKICQKTFGTVSSLNRHSRRHTNDFAFSCLICNKKFKAKDNLNDHVRRFHMNSERHLCHLCDKIFTSKSNLNFHIKMHTGKNAVKCPICSYTVHSKYYLATHMKMHEGKQPSCWKCNKKFNQNEELSAHVESDCGGKRLYICFVCNKEYISRHGLYRHRKNNHQGISLGTGSAPTMAEVDTNQMTNNPVECQVTHTSTMKIEILKEEGPIENLVEYLDLKQPKKELDGAEDEIIVQDLVTYQIKEETPHYPSRIKEEPLDALGMPACSSGIQKEMTDDTQSSTQGRMILESIGNCDSEIDIKDELDTVKHEQEMSGYALYLQGCEDQNRIEYSE
ncbi:hypothetical protein QAD02_006490 [Eretmocerus hayati]|uniref:Uncharacterized protein n=1 Tax=Eretmocerus hayati TaxID=131215 RepID=A0ACC2N1I1_9HYME|nr:hypothetical protein QAD02_006490 [Eretmocerus hayati]